MMDLGFFPAIRRIMSFLPSGHQTLLLSATMPKQVRSLAKEFLTDPIDVSIGQRIFWRLRSKNITNKITN